MRLAIGENMTLLELQGRILGGVGQGIEWRMSHVLCSEMLMLVYHVRRWQMAKLLVWLMETGGNHVASVRRGLGHNILLDNSDGVSMAMIAGVVGRTQWIGEGDNHEWKIPGSWRMMLADSSDR